MWHLTKITATNICAFESLEYSLTQNEATLIFGHNLDNDSQNSNGSGKSALIEAIAIGLTGDPLRKVNVDEIINDRFDEATVCIHLSNHELGCTMIVNRKLSRKHPQQIQIIRQYGPYDTDVEEVVQPSVADYNKYVLEQIGLTKEDILSNFILTARKYKSFLSSSDKDKKELINRFSNGLLVDESIEALQNDLQPIEEEYVDADLEVSRCNGSIAAMEREIERTINESSKHAETRKERIKNWEELIAEKRGKIRDCKENIAKLEDTLDLYDALDSDMQDLEKSDTDTVEAYTTIAKRFKELNLQPILDYSSKVTEVANELKSERERSSELARFLVKATEELDVLQADLEQVVKSNLSKNQKYDKEIELIKESMSDLGTKAKELSKEGDELRDKSNEISSKIAKLEKTLMGTIRCPKCSHEFLYDVDVDVEEARASLEKFRNELKKLNKKAAENETEYDNVINEGKAQRILLNTTEEHKEALREIYRKAKAKYDEANDALSSIKRKSLSRDEKVNHLANDLSRMREKMFDEVFETIDDSVRQAEKRIDREESEISSLKGAIKSYEERIEEAKNATEDDIVANLKQSKAKYEKDLKTALKQKETIEAKRLELKKQETTFIEFKTYLANTKINAISQITNDFLATIGSDIRVALSGYTILKSGKVRDKISVSVTRDGVDCGSFEKLSAGERVRLELASILAMRQLTNVNAEDGRGLNLLVCDEILDSSDESGLANIFKALNRTGVTSLVVSHGSVAENYPNRLVVHKRNGVSSLDT